MKYLILGCVVVMLLASYAIRLSLPENQSTLPVVYWVTDPNPARTEQIALFHNWLKANGYPDMDLRLDTNNGTSVKKVIHGVSGVGGDIMDMISGADMYFFHAMGLMANLTEPAKRLGFDPSKTYASLKSEITIPDDHGVAQQYMFPCNAFNTLFFVNLDTFKKYNQPPPPTRWTIEEFERRGRAFVAAANPPGTRKRVFFADAIDLRTLRRSYGVDRFNETLTRCTLDDPRSVAALQKLRDWTDKDHLLPSSSDKAMFTTASGYGGQAPQLFDSGTYAMLGSGRHLIIQWREFNKSRVRQGQPVLHMALVESPHGGFPNCDIGTRAAMVYAGTKHPDLAILFVAFLASKEYNMQIVHDADALPPNPIYTEIPEFKHPTLNVAEGIYPESEGNLHEPFAIAANTIAIPQSISPFVLSFTVNNEESLAEGGFLADPPLWDAAYAGRQATDRINFEIQQTLHEKPALQQHYNELLKRQALIDQYKKEGRKIPAAWVDNPFYKTYYQKMGMLDETKPSPQN